MLRALDIIKIDSSAQETDNYYDSLQNLYIVDHAEYYLFYLPLLAGTICAAYILLSGEHNLNIYDPVIH